MGTAGDGEDERMIFACTDEFCSTTVEGDDRVWKCPNCGKSMKEVRKACSYDHYMDAKEAVEFGLVDEIVDTLL